MSLKAFHVVFILLSILCTVGFAAWAMVEDDAGLLLRGAGVFSGILGVALAGYGYWFVTRKAGRIIT